MVSNIFYVHPNLGKVSNLTNIFQMGGSTTNQMMNEWWVNDDWMRMVLIDDSATNQIPTIHFPSTADVFQVWLCLPIPFLEGTCCLRSSTRQEFRRTKTSQGSKTLFPCSNDPILFNFIDTTFDIWNICVYIYIYNSTWGSKKTRVASVYDQSVPCCSKHVQTMVKR